jgi:type I restriction enzyme S subunit
VSAFSKYPAYKDSGVEWLGEVPEHWEVRRNLGIFDERKEANQPNAELLSVTQDRGIIRQSEITAKKDSSNDDKSKYKVVRVGDLAYNKMRAWQGALGVSEFDGIVSPAYIVLTPRNPKLARFFHYLYRTPSFITEANRLSYGLCDDMNSLRYEDFKTSYSPIPKDAEIDRIVAFLDEKTAQIDDLIAKKQRQIELLDEQKAILINRAVTRSLHPNPYLHDSGLPWLPKFPSSWSLVRFKSLDGGAGVTVQIGPFGGMLKDLPSVPTGFKVYGQENTISGDLEKGGRWLEAGRFRLLSDYAIKTDDILLTRKGSIGNAFRVPNEFTPGIIDSDTIRVRVSSSRLLLDYFLMLMKEAPFMTEQIVFMSKGAIIAGLNSQTIKNLVFPLPSVDEQKAILLFLGDLKAKFDKARSNVESQIQTLQTLRSTLIAHAVTGKIKV